MSDDQRAHTPLNESQLDTQNLSKLAYYLQPSTTSNFHRPGQKVFNSSYFKLSGEMIDSEYLDFYGVDNYYFFEPYCFEIKVMEYSTGEDYCEKIGQIYGYLIKLSELTDDILLNDGNFSFFEFDDPSQLLCNFWGMIQETLLEHNEKDPLYNSCDAEYCFLIASFDLREDFANPQVVDITTRCLIPSYLCDLIGFGSKCLFYSTDLMAPEDFLTPKVDETYYLQLNQWLKEQGWIDLTHTPFPCLMKWFLF